MVRLKDPKAMPKKLLKYRFNSTMVRLKEP